MGKKNDIPVQCCRCKHKHMESQRKSKLVSSSGISMSDLVCPKCECKTYYDMREQVAWCWRSGLIEIGDEMPANSPEGGGAIFVARGPKAFLKAELEVAARHGQGASVGKLIVPGVPEAESDEDAANALKEWLEWRSKGSWKKGIIYGAMK